MELSGLWWNPVYNKTSEITYGEWGRGEVFHHALACLRDFLTVLTMKCLQLYCTIDRLQTELKFS